MSLIKINNKKESCSKTIADKFFLLGAFLGFFGTTYLGVHLLLMQIGIIQNNKDYEYYKIIHILLQNYFFFGFFILGFFIQAHHKIFEIENLKPQKALLNIPISILGFIFILISTNSTFARFLIVVPFLYSLILLFKITKVCDLKKKITLCLPSLIGLLTFIILIFSNLTSTILSLLLLWSGSIAFIFVAGQQFVSGVLGCSKLSFRSGIIFNFFYLSSIIVLILFSTQTISNNLYWRIFIVLSLSTILSFFFGCKIYKINFAANKDVLKIAFPICLLWAIIGLIFSFDGVYKADKLIHILATGWLLPLIIFVSSRVFNHFSNKNIFSDKILIIFLFLWQIVPITRGLLHVANPTLSYIMSFISLALLGLWTTGMIRGFYIINFAKIKEQKC